MGSLLPDSISSVALTRSFRPLPPSSENTAAASVEPTMAPINRPCIRRSEEHTSELQSLMRLPYAVFCLQKKKVGKYHTHPNTNKTYHTPKHYHIDKNTS